MNLFCKSIRRGMSDIIVIAALTLEARYSLLA